MVEPLQLVFSRSPLGRVPLIRVISRTLSYLGGCHISEAVISRRLSSLGGCHPEGPSGREGSLQLISNTWGPCAQYDSAGLLPRSCGT